MPILKNKTRNFNKVAITTGDPNGIGFEVSAKALVEYKKKLIKNKTLFFVFRDSNQEKKQSSLFKKIDSVFNRVTFENLDLALSFSNSLGLADLIKNNILIDLSLNTSAADWIVDATKACVEKNFDSLVTGPISKTLIKSSGYPYMGHTGIFKHFFPQAHLNMGFVGKSFNVLLVTDHIELSKAEKTLTKKLISTSLKSALILKKAVGSKKKIAVLGLNPHAGESGLIGHFEKKLLSKLPPGFVGPLVPDAAFLKKNLEKFSLFVCLYHDQGLIPFKMHHGQDSGVHITIGLPFVRTSVDHGTAFDLYNKNLANHSSMLDAIKLNLKLLETKNV